MISEYVCVRCGRFSYHKASFKMIDEDKMMGVCIPCFNENSRNIDEWFSYDIAMHFPNPRP